MSLSAGSRLGPYEIQSPLGRGGMGEVYKARDSRLDRTIAIPVMQYLEGETLADRLQKGRVATRSGASLRHRNCRCLTRRSPRHRASRSQAWQRDANEPRRE